MVAGEACRPRGGGHGRQEPGALVRGGRGPSRRRSSRLGPETAPTCCVTLEMAPAGMGGLRGWALYCGMPVGCVYGPGADPYGRWVCFQDFRLEGRVRRYAGTTLSELLREIEDRF